MKLKDNFDVSKLKSLFSTKNEPDNLSSQIEQDVINTASHTRKSNETYHQYGFRIAGLSGGSIYMLPPCLQSVYLGIKKEQENNESLQQILQASLSREKAEMESEKERKSNQLEESKQKQHLLNKDLEDEKSKLTAIEAAEYERNKSEWIALLISGIILIPFTIYLFIFYSSVAYSAFFKQFNISNLDSNGDFVLSQAIFDGAAIPNAYYDGYGELLFILFMPIIFLAFGFILNRWERETNFLKYIKIPLMILVAFIFDALLAYTISEKIYNLKAMMILGEVQPYGLLLAIKDSNFWITICLGFVSYIIWGFVFSYFVKAWENLDLNKTKKKDTEEKIKELRNNIESETRNESTLKDEIANIHLQIANIESKMGISARYDLAKIKLELSNFFSGWQQYLAALQRPDNEKQDATNVFNDFINNIDKQ